MGKDHLFGCRIKVLSDDAIEAATRNLPVMLAYDSGSGDYSAVIEYCQDPLTGYVFIKDVRTNNNTLHPNHSEEEGE